MNAVSHSCNEIGKIRNLTIDTNEIYKLISQGSTTFFKYIASKLNANICLSSDIEESLEGISHLIPQQTKMPLEKLLRLLYVVHLDYSFINNTLKVFRLSEEETTQLETYNVSELVTLVDDFELPENYFSCPKHKVFGINFEELSNNSKEYYTESFLAQLIKESVFKEYQDSPKAFITSTPGKLFISHFPHIHRKIRHFLEELRCLAELQMDIKSHFLTVKSNFFKQNNIHFTPLYSEENNNFIVGLYAILSPEEEQQLFSCASESKNAEIVAEETFQLRHLETKNICKGNRTDFLAGYNSENSEDIIGRMYEGIAVQLRPEIHEETKEISFSVNVTMAIIPKPIPSFFTPQGEIAVPNQMVQKMNVCIRVPYGSSLLLAGLANPYEGKGNKSFASSKKKDNLMICFKATL